MSKPDWCTQEIWHQAGELFFDAMNQHGAVSLTFEELHVVEIAIARAIIAATEAEREACQAVATALYEEWRKKDAHAGLSAKLVRDAIRNRTQA